VTIGFGCLVLEDLIASLRYQLCTETRTPGTRFHGPPLSITGDAGESGYRAEHIGLVCNATGQQQKVDTKHRFARHKVFQWKIGEGCRV
jgi:hypothetical protein